MWPLILFLRSNTKSKRNTNLNNTSPVWIFIYLYIIYYEIRNATEHKKNCILRKFNNLRSGEGNMAN